jgi:hypothetical protein
MAFMTPIKYKMHDIHGTCGDYDIHKTNNTLNS